MCESSLKPTQTAKRTLEWLIINANVPFSLSHTQDIWRIYLDNPLFGGIRDDEVLYHYTDYTRWHWETHTRTHCCALAVSQVTSVCCVVDSTKRAGHLHHHRYHRQSHKNPNITRKPKQITPGHHPVITDHQRHKIFFCLFERLAKQTEFVVALSLPLSPPHAILIVTWNDISIKITAISVVKVFVSK